MSPIGKMRSCPMAKVSETQFATVPLHSGRRLRIGYWSRSRWPCDGRQEVVFLCTNTSAHRPDRAKTNTRMKPSIVYFRCLLQVQHFHHFPVFRLPGPQVISRSLAIRPDDLRKVPVRQPQLPLPCQHQQSPCLQPESVARQTSHTWGDPRQPHQVAGRPLHLLPLHEGRRAQGGLLGLLV